MNYKVNFKNLKLEVPFKGIKHKFLDQENIRVRLVEYDQKMPTYLCEKSHYGYVLNGIFEIEFDDQKIIYERGDGLFLPAGKKHCHKGRAITEKVIIFFVELSKPSEKEHIWIAEKVNNEWGGLTHLRPSVHGYPAVASSGNLYLSAGDIWISRFVDEHYTEMEKLGNAINTKEFSEVDQFIAPDESYLLFCRNEGLGSWDIFVSFRKEDGSWTKARNMGEPINSSASDVYPFVTSDGKYLFFASSRTSHPNYSKKPLTYAEKIRILNSHGNGNADIYWVDAKIIENLNQKRMRSRKLS